jgi:hypothetical protein
MKTEEQNIESASVSVKRSYDNNNFEVSLSSSSATTPEAVEELRKTAQRLADRAVEQFKTAKLAAERRDYMQQQWLLTEAKNKPENERNPDEKACIRYHEDAAFAAQFEYDYGDDWEEPE